MHIENCGHWIHRRLKCIQWVWIIDTVETNIKLMGDDRLVKEIIIICQKADKAWKSFGEDN